MEDEIRFLRIQKDQPGFIVNPFTGQSVSREVVLGVKRMPEWGEFKVTVKIGDTYDEGKAGYIPIEYGREEVASQLVGTAEWAAKNGYVVRFTKGAQKFLE